MAGIMDRIRGLASLFWREVAKFGAVGGVAFVIDNGLYWYLIHGPMSGSEVKARFVSAGVATIFAWVANRYWTFRHKRAERPAHMQREVVLFLVFNAIGALITMACVALAIDVFDVTDPAGQTAARLVGIVIGTIFRFWTYRQFVFVRELTHLPPVPDPESHDDDAMFRPPRG